MYLTTTRLDIIFIVSLLSRFMQNPSKMHFCAMKRVLRYVWGTSNFGLIGFTDDDWTSSIDDRKSTSGYIFSLGLGAISWSSKKHSLVSLSSTEAKYIVITSASY